MTLDAFKTQLALTAPDTPVIVELGNTAENITAADLQGAFQVQYQPPVTVAYKAKVNAAPGLRLRESALVLSFNIIEVMPFGTIVDVLDEPVPTGWLNVRAPDGKIGYSATQYLDKIVVTPPATGTRQLIGVHVLQDGLNVVDQLLADVPGITLPSATVINETAIVKALLPRTKYVIFRSRNSEIDAALPDDPTASAKQATDYVANNAAWIKAIGAYVQPINEVKIQSVANAVAHNAYWLAYMQALDALGCKGAICAYGMGQPEVNEWQALEPCLQYAMSHGHIVVLHVYSAAGTPVGSLSTDTTDFELRPVQLYNSVSQNAWPDLVISECAHNGVKTEGADEAAAFAQKMNELYNRVMDTPYLVGINLWTFGTLGWPGSSIDNAEKQIATGIQRGWL